MNKEEREAYQAELKRVARRLSLPQSGEIEKSIIQHCVGQLRDWLTVHGKPGNLSDLMVDFAASLDMQIVEVRSEADMDALLVGMPDEQQATIGRLKSEFDEYTDAVTIRRFIRKPWERAFLAIVNCQGRHDFRRYFSTWHEIVHRLTEGQQLTFAFRHTKENRPEPEEVLVDRITAELAFFPDIFEPVVLEECQKDGTLTFAAIDRVRHKIAPEASRLATSLACIKHVSNPTWFLRCGMRLKTEEAQRLQNPQMTFFPEEPPEPKLRVRSGVQNPAARDFGVTFFGNMRVPEASIVARALSNDFRLTAEGIESLDTWETSSGGPIGSGSIHVEAEWASEGEVWAIVQLLDIP